MPVRAIKDDITNIAEKININKMHNTNKASVNFLRRPQSRLV
jgi:hypothetical protein